MEIASIQQPKFKIGDHVRISNIYSPYYRKEGVILNAYHLSERPSCIELGWHYSISCLDGFIMRDIAEKKIELIQEEKNMNSAIVPYAVGDCVEIKDPTAPEVHGKKCKIIYADTVSGNPKNWYYNLNTLNCKTLKICNVPHSALIPIPKEEYMHYARCLNDFTKIKPVDVRNVISRIDCIPQRIIYNNPATIVFWSDGAKTVVKKAKGEKFNEYTAFCAALAKKIYGNNSKVNKIVKSGTHQEKK